METMIFKGIWPVAPTSFKEDGTIDYQGIKNILDCMVDQGVDGACILANYSEQFLISDEERKEISRVVLEHVDGRIPIIVTISHFATAIALARANYAKKLGAAAVMMMPPYHGATLRGTDQQTFEQIEMVGELGIPIMIQDSPLSGVELSVESLARMAKDIEMVKMFKIECIGAASKLKELIDKGDGHIGAPFDGEEGITLLADLHAGAVGSMTSSLIPDLIKPIITQFAQGKREEASSLYDCILPIINYENRQCGFRGTKHAMKIGGVIESDFCRHPIKPLPQETGNMLINLLRRHDPVVLSWGG